MTFDPYWLGPIVAGLGALRPAWRAFRKWWAGTGDVDGVDVLKRAGSVVLAVTVCVSLLPIARPLALIAAVIFLPGLVLPERRLARLDAALWRLFDRRGYLANQARLEREQAAMRALEQGTLLPPGDDAAPPG